ncbi:MAG: alpha-hydroxy-acid oxidizing protein [Treponema sp.]|nr:alpha-hydroxy-acid oxidizing protein [Treponema sp.]
MDKGSLSLSKGELKCHRCARCNGYGCPDMLPGLGGVMGGVNFQANCADWKALAGTVSAEALDAVEVLPSKLRCGPVTGAVENIGYASEGDFYYPYLKNAYDAGFGLCIGDGCPDEKLKFGIAAVEKIEQEAGVGAGANLDAAFFLKPYPQERLFERIEWIGKHARYIGIDIDSYNILTMRNLVNLERKTAAQLEEFRKRSGVPFVIKGVFTDEDIELVKQVHPDVVYISNHGGRVETRKGSTADFLAAEGSKLKKYCDQLWIDGGIRTRRDIQTALYYGADQVIMARSPIRATFDEHYDEFVKGLGL